METVALSEHDREPGMVEARCQYGDCEDHSGAADRIRQVGSDVIPALTGRWVNARTDMGAEPGRN